MHFVNTNKKISDNIRQSLSSWQEGGADEFDFEKHFNEYREENIASFNPIIGEGKFIHFFGLTNFYNQKKTPPICTRYNEGCAQPHLAHCYSRSRTRSLYEIGSR